MGAAIALTLGMIAALVPGSAASASDPDVDQTYGFTVEGDSDAFHHDNCSGQATAPHRALTTPDYLQWEGHITCTVPHAISLEIKVYKLVGTGDNERSVWVDYSIKSTPGSRALDLDDSTPCAGTASTRYYTVHRGKIDGQNMAPYPSYSSRATLACYVPGM
jgi:hypothetical protein